ncbi:MAG: hypothetical protein GEV08_03385 [Acidimicrobiia bacterium]|nr:hypothetical protein [Acidimicrobiia bacterium]
MPLLHAIVLGIVQGLTEFFPVSSSGHLILVPWLFGWEDFGGDEHLAKTFDVALHLGTLVGVVGYFRADLWRYVRAGLAVLVERRRPVPTDGRLAWLLVLATVPAGLTGLFLKDLINRLDDQIWLIAVMLLVGGALLAWADRVPEKRATDELSPRDALLVGAAQAVALQPGASRSGMTITAGRFLGFDRAAAARLSFLMSVPVISGAVVFSFADALAGGGIPADFVAPFAAGIGSSALTGFAAVWATLRVVSAHSFAPFVAYRVVVGLLVLGLLASGAR